MRYYLSIILTLLFAPAFAQDTASQPCDAYAQMLRGEIADVTAEEFAECEILEQISVSFRSLDDYMLKYRANFNGSGHPVWIFVAANSLNKGDEPLAFAAADAAINESTVFFVNLGDRERAALYPTLSNDILPDLGINGSQNILCLVTLDAYTVPLIELLNSTTFRYCLGQ